VALAAVGAVMMMTVSGASMSDCTQSMLLHDELAVIFIKQHVESYLLALAVEPCEIPTVSVGGSKQDLAASRISSRAAKSFGVDNHSSTSTALVALIDIRSVRIRPDIAPIAEEPPRHFIVAQISIDAADFRRRWDAIR
jgi:hypothetical protein